jgi:hypothetical protein
LPTAKAQRFFFFFRPTGTGGLVRRYLLYQFPRPATLQAAYFAADMPAGNFAAFKKFIILFIAAALPAGN